MNVAERLEALCRIDSVIGNEKPLADFLAQRLAEHAPAYELIRVDDNLVLRPRARVTERKVVGLVGHLDTVPVSADNPVRVEGDRLYGLGSSDMKSGDALMWDLLEKPVAEPAYDIVAIFYTGEEGDYDQSGLGPTLEQLPWLAETIDLAICLEPSDNVLQLGCMGTIHAEVNFAGRAAHSARPWQGENALYKAASLLSHLAQRKPNDVRFGAEELLYREVLTATLAKGGTARNVVPSSFMVNVNYRFAPDRSLDSAQKVIRDIVAEHCPVDTDINFTDLSPSGPIPEDNPLLADFKRKTGVDVAPKQAWTDVARLAAAGIDSINWGPGQNAQAHQPDEWCSLSYLAEGDRLLRRFLSK